MPHAAGQAAQRHQQSDLARGEAHASPRQWLLQDRCSIETWVITDQAINEFRFTGTVSREHIDEWLFALSEIFPLDVRRVGDLASHSEPTARSIAIILIV